MHVTHLQGKSLRSTNAIRYRLTPSLGCSAVHLELRFMDNIAESFYLPCRSRRRYDAVNGGIDKANVFFYPRFGIFGRAFITWPFSCVVRVVQAMMFNGDSLPCSLRYEPPFGNSRAINRANGGSD